MEASNSPNMTRYNLQQWMRINGMLRMESLRPGIPHWAWWAGDARVGRLRLCE